jgi:hypothetical protein
MRERLNLAKAKVVLSLSRDILSTTGEPMGMVQAREFAATRRVLKASDEMSRLYVVEPAYTLTGGQADHRLTMPASQIARVAAAVAVGVLAKVGGEAAGALRGEVASLAGDGLENTTKAFVEAAVEDLLAAGGLRAGDRGARSTRIGPCARARDQRRAGGDRDHDLVRRCRS